MIPLLISLSLSLSLLTHVVLKSYACSLSKSSTPQGRRELKMAAGAVQMLQKSLLAAQKDLSTTDDAIKKLIGRDPNAKP